MEDLRLATSNDLWDNEQLITAVINLNKESLANEKKDIKQQKEIDALKKEVADLKKLVSKKSKK